MNKGIIYKYTSPSSKVYIGQTVNPSKRKCGHNSRTKKANTKFGCAIRKYGLENFEYEILFETDVFEDKSELKLLLNELEIKYIAQYDSYNNGYNCTKGGDGSLGIICSEETREKRRLAGTGRKHTPEAIEKMKKNRTPVPISETTKEALNKSKNKPVLQFTKSGEFIQEWESITIAANANNINRSGIYNCCNGRGKTASGFVWKHKNTIQQ